jgi:glycosyltransferase involved in cell wall biosynthesis
LFEWLAIVNMKILHVIPSISRKRGGPSTAIISMVRALRNEGVDASILTTSDHNIYREDEMPIGRWFWKDGVPILIFPSVNSQSVLFQEYLISPALSWWLFQNIKNYDALHVHSIFSYSSTTSMLIARLKRVPYIVRTIGQLNTWSLSQSRWRKMIMLFLIEKCNLMASFAIHVTSLSEKEDVQKVCKHHNILCLGLGVEISKTNQLMKLSQHEETRFIFLSRIHPKKQLDKLLEAFSILYNSYNKRSWRLFIAGDGDHKYVEHLKVLSEAKGISSCVEWMGHLGEEEKFSLMGTCDWYVLPSLSENFGLSVVEALASGLPVIISPEVGISKIVAQSNAGLVTGSSVSLLEALGRAMHGAPTEMREAALKLARERFSWREIARVLLICYRNQIIAKGHQ